MVRKLSMNRINCLPFPVWKDLVSTHSLGHLLKRSTLLYLYHPPVPETPCYNPK